VFGFGWMELLLILVIVLIVFGAGKLPQLGEGVGKAIKGFKKSVHEPELEQIPVQQASSAQPTPATPSEPTVGSVNPPVQRAASTVKG
jgi:sec-independent protein translocase protein TatA